MYPAWLVLAACGSPSGSDSASTPSDSASTPADSAPVDLPHDSATSPPSTADTSVGTSDTSDTASGSAPGVGAHALAYYRYGAGIDTTLTTAPVTTAARGSTIVVSVGRGDLSASVAPTDSAGNTPYQQLGTEHAYTLWPSSGTATYAFAGATGGAGFTVSTTGPLYDETTLVMVEVTGGGEVTDQSWTEVTSGPLTSAPVTTRGPATLVAFWWGDADGSVPHTATPDGGFTLVESLFEAGSLVQSAAAVATVDAAGTYDVTWTATPVQGAQLWLVAVESAE